MNKLEHLQTNSIYKLLTKKELCSEVLGCDEKTFDEKYRYEDGFPFIKTSEKSHRKYPVWKVIEWLENRVEYQ